MRFNRQTSAQSYAGHFSSMTYQSEGLYVDSTLVYTFCVWLELYQAANHTLVRSHLEGKHTCGVFMNQNIGHTHF